jgi:hypothetical protein
MPESEPAPVVFLLGAGASVDAGCPTVVDLVAGFRGFVEQAASSREVAALEEINALLAESSLVRQQRAIVDVELLLATIRALADRDNNPLSAFVRQWRRPVRQFASSLPLLDKLLQRYIRQECTVHPATVEYLWPIADFVDLYGRVDVFTLNYDASVEIVCQQREIPYTDGFDLYWNPAQFDSSLNRLRLFKLHGSLLWYVTRATPRKLVKIPVRAPAPDQVKFFTDEELSDVLIYPTLAKEQHVEPYATLIGEFRKTLANAKVLVAIGCSFRDEYIKQIIVDRMLHNPDLQVIVVDPNAADVVNRSDAVLGPEWTFDSVKHRISLFHSQARYALSRRVLLDHVRDLQSSSDLEQVYERSVLTGEAAEERIAKAGEYVKALVKAEHVGSLARLLPTLDNMSPVAQATAREIHNSQKDVPGAGANVPLFLMVAVLSGASLQRRLAKQWIEEHFKWVFQYVVWKTNGGYRALTLGQPNPAIESSVEDFFLEHQERVEATLISLSRWADRMQFGIPRHIAIDVRELVEDLDLASRYFRQAAEHAEQGRSAIFSSFEGRFPRGSDDQCMREIGHRFGDVDLPAALVSLLGNSDT